MSVSATDLSLDDIQFLKTVRDVCADSSEYPDRWTADGESPATTTAIREVSGLDKSQVQYRLTAGSDGRGLDEGESPLVQLYDPPMTPSGYGPKSAELTEHGEEVLASALTREDVQDAQGVLAAGSAGMEEVAQLAETLDELEGTVRELQETVMSVDETVSGWESDEFGSVDGETAARLRTLIDIFPVFNMALEQVLEVPMQELTDRRGDLDDEDFQEIRREVAEALAADAEGRGSEAADEGAAGGIGESTDQGTLGQ